MTTENIFDIPSPSFISSDTSQLLSEISDSPKFVVVASRPNVGKTEFGIELLRSVSITSGKSSLLFSLETDSSETLTRIIAQQANVSQDKITTGNLSTEEKTLVNKAKEEIASSKIFLWHDKETSLENIHRTCLARKNSAEGLDIVLIDYLQLMSVSKNVSANRQDAIATISHGLKILSKELGITVILFSQLGRNAEKRVDKTPVISDLRDSTALEQDADVIILLNRPSLYDSTASNDESFAIVAKNRSGSTGIYSLKAA